MENEMKNMLTKNNRDLILLEFDEEYRYSVVFGYIPFKKINSSVMQVNKKFDKLS